MSEDADRMIVLGRFGAAFGVKGWLKVESFTDPPEGILKYTGLSVASRDATWEPVKILQGRRHGNGRTLVVAVEGLSSPEAAQYYGTREIAVPRSALPATRPGEVYWEDLVGCTAVTLEGVELGVVRHLLEFPANPVMAVSGDGRERWIPLVPQHLKSFDLEAKRVTVDWDPEF
ncbi:MAG: ribosome maturation factor RimM [Pseudomonadota bacterium]